jgi:hypothetical protein
MRIERVKMCVKVHPLGLSLLLINVRNPDEWRSTRGKCGTNLRYEKVRRKACKEAAGPEHKQVCVVNRGKRA